MSTMKIDIAGCELVPVSANRDGRGCLFEIFRQSWPGAFPTVQWNACASAAGVVRGVHVHVDYHEFYTLPQGRVEIGLVDIRADSPTFRHAAQFDWSDEDSMAVVVPRGVAHVVLFKESSVLGFGLSDYWRPEFDVVGCQWNDPELGLQWRDEQVLRSNRDATSGSFREMLSAYEERSRAWREQESYATA